jgi:hypothetical protein
MLYAYLRFGGGGGEWGIPLSNWLHREYLMIYLVWPACTKHIFLVQLLLRDDIKKKYFLLLHHCYVGNILVCFEQLRTFTVNSPSTIDVAAPSGHVNSYNKHANISTQFDEVRIQARVSSGGWVFTRH